MADPTPSDPARDRLLHGPLAWTVLRFGAPLAAAMVLQVVFNLVDQYIIARLPPALARQVARGTGLRRGRCLNHRRPYQSKQRNL